MLNCGYGNGSSVLETIDAVRRASGTELPAHFVHAGTDIRQCLWLKATGLANCLTGISRTMISTPSKHSIGSGASSSVAHLDAAVSASEITSIVPPGFYLRLYPLGVPRVVA